MIVNVYQKGDEINGEKFEIFTSLPNKRIEFTARSMCDIIVKKPFKKEYKTHFLRGYIWLHNTVVTDGEGYVSSMKQVIAHDEYPDNKVPYHNVQIFKDQSVQYTIITWEHKPIAGYFDISCINEASEISRECSILNCERDKDVNYNVEPKFYSLEHLLTLMDIKSELNRICKGYKIIDLE